MENNAMKKVCLNLLAAVSAIGPVRAGRTSTETTVTVDALREATLPKMTSLTAACQVRGRT